MTSWRDSLLRITLELLPVDKLEKSILVRMTYCLCSERTHLSADFLSCIVYSFTVRLFTSAVWICISCPSTTHASTHIHARTRAYRRPHAQTHTAKHWLKTVRSSQNSFSSIFSVKRFFYIYILSAVEGARLRGTWWTLAYIKQWREGWVLALGGAPWKLIHGAACAKQTLRQNKVLVYGVIRLWCKDGLPNTVISVVS